MRIDVDDFTISTGVKVVDLSKVVRQQIPSQPDNELRGFLHGFAAGEYLYLAPHFGRDFHGKLVRIDMRDFGTLADLQAADLSTDVPVGTPGAYTGVQYVDLERSDPNLVGFSGGFSVRSSEPMVEKPLDSPEKRSEWWEQCHYVPLADGEAASSSSSRVAHVTRREFFANRYCSDEPVKKEETGKMESLYVVMRECLESRIGLDGASAFFPYEEPYCYTNFRIPLDSARLPGCDRGTDTDCHWVNEPYTYLKKDDQEELNKIELEHRETCSDFHDEIGLEHFSTSETGVALNEATPGLVEITPEGDDYVATFPRVVL